MTESSRRRWAQALLIVAALMVLWALVAAVTGGFRIQLGPVRISSRNAVRVVLLALVPAAVAWQLFYREWLTDARIASARPRLRRIGFVAAIGAAVVLLLIGARYGVRAAAAADGSGYVSQSALWLRGSLRIDQSFGPRMPWPEAKHAFTTLGYRVGAGDAIVPTYAPGLPLLMALGRIVSPCGPYFVGPVCAALLVLFTFLLGRRIAGTGVAAAAALLTACSPVIVFMMLQPMADVPAAAFWIGALAMAIPGTRRSALAAGALTAIAIAIRPNLAPLAAFPWLMALVRADRMRARLVNTAIFAAAAAPGALFIAAVNNYLYGSPFESGYGDLGYAFRREYAWTNIRQYSRWWLESQGWLAFVFLASVFRLRTSRWREYAILMGFALVLNLLYVFYLPHQAWWFLRFLLPAVPIALLLSFDVVSSMAARSERLRFAALVVFVLIAGGHSVRHLDLVDALAIGAGEQRYVEPALYAGRTLPADAAIVAMQHSGSVRFYTGRLVVRWDLLEPAYFDRAIETLKARGVPVYALLESWEEPQLRQRFDGHRYVQALDRPPLATARGGEIRLYAIDAPETHESRLTFVIPRSIGRSCEDMAPNYERPAAIRKLE